MLTYFPYLLGYSRKKSLPIQTFLEPARSIFPLFISFDYKENSFFLRFVSFLIALTPYKCPHHSVFVKQTSFFLSGDGGHFLVVFEGPSDPRGPKIDPGGPGAALDHPPLAGLKQQWIKFCLWRWILTYRKFTKLVLSTTSSTLIS